MSYQRQTFVDNETVLTAAMMDHIEDGIVANESAVTDLTDLVAEEFNSFHVYNPGDYVMHDGKLYICTTITTGGWNASAWTETDIGIGLTGAATVAGKCVRYDQAQSLNSTQKTQARNNISAPSVDYVDTLNANEVQARQEADTALNSAVSVLQSQMSSTVKFTEQTLTDAQKKQARDNILAETASVVPITSSDPDYSSYAYVNVSTGSTSVEMDTSGEEPIPKKTSTSANNGVIRRKTVEGDKYTIVAARSGVRYACMFVANDGTILGEYTATEANPAVITAPANTAWFVFNIWASGLTNKAWIGESTANRVDDLEARIANDESTIGSLVDRVTTAEGVIDDLSEQLDKAYTSTEAAVIDKYFVTDCTVGDVILKGNHFIYNSASGYINPTFCSLVGSCETVTGQNLRNYNPSISKYIPVSVFGDQIDIQVYYKDGNLERPLTIGMRFATINEQEEITYVSHTFTPAPTAIDSLVHVSIPVPSTATHVFFCAYMSKRYANVAYDVYYTFGCQPNALKEEKSAREAADTALNTAISSEATTREAADTALSTAIADEASARAEADAENAASESALEERVNALHNLVDYNYGVAIDSDTIAGSNADGAFRFVRTGTYIMINGNIIASSQALNVRFKLNGTPVCTSVASNIDTWGDPLILVNGHKYRLRAHTMSGTATVVNNRLFAVYLHGTHDAISESGMDGSDWTADFTYNNGASGVHVAFSLERNSANRAEFANWVAQVTLEDITDTIIHCTPASQGITDQYFTNNYSKGTTNIQGNHYVFKPASSSGNTLIHCFSGTFVSYAGSLTSFSPTMDQLIPVSVFGDYIKIDYYVKEDGQGYERKPTIGYKFVNVTGEPGSEVITEVARIMAPKYPLNTLVSLDIHVPEDATHVAFVVYYGSGFYSGMTYDIYYNITPGSYTRDVINKRIGYYVDDMLKLVPYVCEPDFTGYRAAGTGATSNIMSRHGERYVVNGTYNTGATTLKYVLQRIPCGYTSGTNYDHSAIDFTKLTDGHTYRVHMFYISGESTALYVRPFAAKETVTVVDEQTTYTPVNIGENHKIGENHSVCDFVYDQGEKGVMIGFEIYRNQTDMPVLTNYTCDIFLEDITEIDGRVFSGSTLTIDAASGCSYVCKDAVTELTFTPCVKGTCDVMFTTGSNPVLNLPNTVEMPPWWVGVESNYTYEMSFRNQHGVVMAWPAT